MDGRLIGDAQVIPGTGLGAGWSWDYLGAAYAAPVAGLQVNENAAQVTLTPGQAAEIPPPQCSHRAESGLTVAQLGHDGSCRIARQRRPRSRPRRHRGACHGVRYPPGADVLRYAAVDHPALYATRMLASALTRRGIVLRDGVVTTNELAAPLPADPAETVRVRHQSPPLASWLSR